MPQYQFKLKAIALASSLTLAWGPTSFAQVNPYAVTPGQSTSAQSVPNAVSNRFPPPPPVAAVPTRPVAPGHPSNSQAQPIKAETLESTQIIARVGPEVILAGEILMTVNSILQEHLAKIPSAQRDQIPPADLERQRLILMQQILNRMLDSKLVVVDALRTIPSDNLPQIEKQVNEQFYNSRVKELMKQAKVESLGGLEAKLKQGGSSIEHHRRTFFEQALASQWIRQKATSDEPVAHEEMLNYYNEHLADYEHVAKARWEQLTARFDSFRSRNAARQAIAEMGNDVLVRGIPFAEVARKRSQGSSASEGGIRDWTTQGALRSQVLDKAIFSLPLARLSTILEDETGYHIIRVTQRVDAHRTPFRDAQVEIEKEIKKERRKAKVEEYFQRLRQEIPVWTIFDDATATTAVP